MNLFRGGGGGDTDILQWVQDAVAPMLSGMPHFHGAIPLLQQRHWLPVIFQAQFKVLIITYKEALHSLGPGYLNNHLVLQISA